MGKKRMEGGKDDLGISLPHSYEKRDFKGRKERIERNESSKHSRKD